MLFGVVILVRYDLYISCDLRSFFYLLLLLFIHFVIRQISAGARPTESPPENFMWGPFIRKQNGKYKGGFTQNAIFIRFCISRIFVQFWRNEPDGYVFTQKCDVSDFASTGPCLKSTHVF